MYLDYFFDFAENEGEIDVQSMGDERYPAIEGGGIEWSDDVSELRRSMTSTDPRPKAHIDRPDLGDLETTVHALAGIFWALNQLWLLTGSPTRSRTRRISAAASTN